MLLCITRCLDRITAKILYTRHIIAALNSFFSSSRIGRLRSSNTICLAGERSMFEIDVVNAKIASHSPSHSKREVPALIPRARSAYNLRCSDWPAS
jgi:hypothetical protein